MPCSNAAKTQNPLKFVGVPQTPEPISAVSGPKFNILSGHVEEVLLLNKFFPIVDTCLRYEDMARQRCAMAQRCRFFATFLHPVFPASRAQHVSDLHSKFTLECGPMPNLMVALPNIGGAFCSTPQSLADVHYYRCRAVTLSRRKTR